MSTTLKTIGVLIALVISTTLWVTTIWLYWDWFFVPAGFPDIPLWNAYGLVTFLTVATWHQKVDDKSDFLDNFTFSVMKSLIAMLSGWIVVGVFA